MQEVAQINQEFGQTIAPFLLDYLLYLSSGILFLFIFSIVYMLFTPYNELALIRAGNRSAALSYAGALIGFALTLAACAIYHTSLSGFIGWATAAMIVQLVGYIVTSRLIPNLKQKILDDNCAVGGFIGVIGLVLGILNAGCLS